MINAFAKGCPLWRVNNIYDLLLCGSNKNIKVEIHFIPSDAANYLTCVNNPTAAACCNFIKLHQLSFLPVAILLSGLAPDAAKCN